MVCLHDAESSVMQHSTYFGWPNHLDLDLTCGMREGSTPQDERNAFFHWRLEKEGHPPFLAQETFRKQWVPIGFWGEFQRRKLSIYMHWDAGEQTRAGDNGVKLVATGQSQKAAVSFAVRQAGWGELVLALHNVPFLSSVLLRLVTLSATPTTLKRGPNWRKKQQ